MKRLAELKSEDFRTSPVWEYRGESDGDALVWPRRDASLSESGSGVFVAATDFQLADGTVVSGYCSPVDDSGLDYLQPVIFVGGVQVPLWCRELGRDWISELCRALGKTIDQVFPIHWHCNARVDGEIRTGEIARAALFAG